MVPSELLPLSSRCTEVANEGSQGGMLYFKGTAPKLAEQGGSILIGYG